MDLSVVANLTVTVLAAISSVGTGILLYLKFFYKRNQSEADRYRSALNEVLAKLERLEYASIMSTAPEWRKDSNRRYQYISPAYELAFLVPINLTRADVIGRTDAEVFHKYKRFVEVLGEIDDAAQHNPERMAIRQNVAFPANQEKKLIVNEVAHSTDKGIIFIGRAYPQKLINK